MKDYVIRESKSHLLSKLVLQILVIFVVSTVSIVLYDIYIDIEVEEGEYTAEKTTKEISIKNTEDVSTMLENSSKSIVRNIKNRGK